MSGTSAPPATPPEPSWAKPAISISYLVAFVAMAIIAYLRNDAQMLTLLGGAVIPMVSQVGNFYLGSSSGSAKKTDLLASAPAITPPPAPAPLFSKGPTP